MAITSPEVIGRFTPCSTGRSPLEDFGEISTPLAFAQGPQRRDRQICFLVMREGIEPEEPHRIEMRDLIDLRIGQMSYGFP
jgi:hypothetical protein